MANIRKQFNFRNGVQVDDDNLIVTSTGLVGIGTSIPNEALDVRGTAKVVGLMTATEVFTPNLTATNATIENLSISTSIIGAGVSIKSGIVTASGSGIVTYYGDGKFLQGLPTSQWLDVDVGLGFTSIYAQGFVGVGTVDPRFLFQVAGTSDTSLAGFANGVGISSSGNILATGIVTASSFVGSGIGITSLNASNISSGTLNNDRLPQNINISGILTASTSITSGNINASGIVTASSELFAGKITVNGNAAISGILTVTENVIGNLVGIASTARTLIGNPNILVNNVTATSIAVTSIDATNINVTGIVTSQSLHIGTGGTAVSLSSNARLGIGSATPTKDLQILKSGEVTLEITGSDKAQIILGQQKTTTSGIGNSTALIRFGDELREFDLLNGDQGNFNYYLHAGSSIAGIQTGDFRWFYGQNLAAPLMTLTFGGNLGIAKTNPDHKLHVVGTSTVTGNAFFGNDVNISGNLTVGGNFTLPSLISGSNIFVTSGISTFNNLKTSGNLLVGAGSSIGISTTVPIASIDARDNTALIGLLGVGTDVFYGNEVVNVNGTLLITEGGIGVGTTAPLTTTGAGGNQFFNTMLDMYGSVINIRNDSQIGFNTTIPRSIFDYGNVGSATTRPVMVVPNISLSTITGIGQTPTGAVIFNTTTNKFQGYTGIAWIDFH